MIARPAARRPAAARRRAFTLLEVLVVVAILVILASLATFASVRFLQQARRDEAKLKMQKIAQAAEAYQVRYGQYPESPEVLIQQQEGLPPLLPGGASAILDPWGQPFSMQVQEDQNGSPRVVLMSGGNGTPIQWPEAGH